MSDTLRQEAVNIGGVMPNIKEVTQSILDSDNPENVLNRFCFDLMSEIIEQHFLPKSAEKFYGADVINILRDSCPK